jgi:hypothetical protein
MKGMRADRRMIVNEITYGKKGELAYIDRKRQGKLSKNVQVREEKKGVRSCRSTAQSVLFHMYHLASAYLPILIEMRLDLPDALARTGCVCLI